MCQEEEPRSIEKENKRKRIVDKKKRHREERRQPEVMEGPARRRVEKLRQRERH